MYNSRHRGRDHCGHTKLLLVSPVRTAAWMPTLVQALHVCQPQKVLLSQGWFQPTLARGHEMASHKVQTVC